MEDIPKWNQQIFYAQKLFFVWQFKAVAFFLIFNLQGEAEQECQDAKGSEDNHRYYIAIGRNAESTNQHGH